MNSRETHVNDSGIQFRIQQTDGAIQRTANDILRVWPSTKPALRSLDYCYSIRCKKEKIIPVDLSTHYASLDNQNLAIRLERHGQPQHPLGSRHWRGRRSQRRCLK